MLYFEKLGFKKMTAEVSTHAGTLYGGRNGIFPVSPLTHEPPEMLRFPLKKVQQPPQDIKGSTLLTQEREELIDRILARAPERLREQFSKALHGFTPRSLTPYLYVPFTKNSAISRSEWGRKINPNNPATGTEALSIILASTKPDLIIAGLELVHMQTLPPKGEKGIRVSYYLREIVPSTPEEAMRRILEKEPITITGLATELNPDMEPAIAAQRTIITLRRLNKDVMQEGLRIAVSGITLLGIMTPEEEKAAIQTFEETISNLNTAIDENSPQIIVDVGKKEVFINGQIIKYKKGQMTWETFLVFLNTPGTYLSNKEVNAAVFERIGEDLCSVIAPLVNEIDRRITRSEALSIFKRNGKGTALSAAVSFLLPGEKFPDDHGAKGIGNDDAGNPPTDLDDELPTETKKTDALKIKSTPIEGTGSYFVSLKKGSMTKPPIRLTNAELNMFLRITRDREIPTLSALRSAMDGTLLSVFDKQGGFEKTFMSLDERLHDWGWALEVDEPTMEGEGNEEIEIKAQVDSEKKESDEKGTSIIKIVAFTPKHKLFIEPVNAILYDEAQNEIAPRQRRRQPSHAKLKI